MPETAAFLSVAGTQCTIYAHKKREEMTQLLSMFAVGAMTPTSSSGSKSLRRHMSSDSVISAVSATSQQSLMSTADVDRKKKKNKNWVGILSSVVSLSL